MASSCAECDVEEECFPSTLSTNHLELQYSIEYTTITSSLETPECSFAERGAL